ncbi:MAG: hypothetical protein EP330_26735 [Deltaproteobacteria bacterium]|nr:MAG: hypothetical protein EP330_26735 [Deltaproteobacteria bacterium]
MKDPALRLRIDPPWTARLTRLLPVTPLIGWVIVAVFTLVNWRHGTPPWWLLLPLVFSGVFLVIAAMPLVALSLWQVGVWFAVLRSLRRAVVLVRAKQLDEAETLLRGCLGYRLATPATRIPVLQTLGVVRLSQGDPELAWLLMERVRDSGWLETLAYRRTAGLHAQGRAMCLIVLGRLAEARDELDFARAHVRGAEAEAYVRHAEVMLALREQDWAAAITAIEATDLTQLPPSVGELHPALAAIARRGLGEEATITLAAEARPRWLDHWPALRDALDER